MLWLHSLAHSRWLEAEADRTFEFGRNAAVPTGFGWLSNEGQPRAGVDTQLWITRDLKSTRLNSSHVAISYAVVCFRKKRRKGIEVHQKTSHPQHWATTMK